MQWMRDGETVASIQMRAEQDASRFLVPRDGKPAVPAKNAQTEFSCGLAWFLKGERVRGLGPEHAALGDGTRVFDRVTRREWVNSYIGRDK
jgi:hypothetical protein